mgnify:CR=1 FL=1
MKKVNKKVRLNFDVTEVTLREIDEAVKLVNVPTRARLFRDALRLFMLVKLKQKEGYEVQLVKGDKKETVALLSSV